MPIAICKEAWKNVAVDSTDLPMAEKYIVQPKLDGFRVCVIRGEVVGRWGLPIPNQEIQDVLHEHPGNADGELIVYGSDGKISFRDTASFVKSRSATGANWKFIQFDDMGDGPYIERLARCQKAVDDFQCGRVAIIDSTYVDGPQIAFATARAFVDAGYEGGIISTAEHRYRIGRCPDVRKVKFRESSIGRIVGYALRKSSRSDAVRTVGGRISAVNGYDELKQVGGLYVRSDDFDNKLLRIPVHAPEDYRRHLHDLGDILLGKTCRFSYDLADADYSKPRSPLLEYIEGVSTPLPR